MKKKYEEEDFFDDRKEKKTARKIASRRDRSKFKKTDSDKRKRNLQEVQEKKLSKKELFRGRVLSIAPEEILVEYEGEVIPCVLRGLLKKEITRAKNIITVGDFVLFELEKKGEGSIAHVEDRKSTLSRTGHHHRQKEQLIAANIDQVLITVSVAEPPLKSALVDRYIIASLKGNMTPIIVINKIDLLQKGGAEEALYHSFLKIYKELGIPVISLSSITGEGIETLKAQMKGKASVFSGQSGVGKSSLINMITGLELSVGDVMKKTKKGSHTTSTAHLIPLSFGGWCIDTPGIRSFGIWDLKREDLEVYFTEIQELSQACKFPNCTHSHEPECAVIQGVEEGKISPLRYDSYQKLLLDC